MKSKKLLSLLLALVMMLSVVPFYASAAQIALKATHVTEWPTASGEMYYGQIIGEHITLSGGKVVYEGVEVPGHFEHIDPNISAENAQVDYQADIKFVPDDTATYKGFNKLYSKTKFNVNKTTPVFVNKTNNPLVATEVEPGAKLSTSNLSGGQVMNPYWPEEPKALAKTWAWKEPDTIINESGYYEAILSINSSYIVLYENVYVRIAGEIPETTIAEVPTVDTLIYDGVTTWGDVKLKGGKATLKVEGTEVAGTFTVDEAYKDTVPTAGEHNLPITFTPDDPEAALPYSFKIPVTVNKATVKFIDSNGTSTIPEITVPYGLKMSDDIGNYLKSYLNTSASFNFTETQYYNEYIPVGTHDLTVKASCSNANYESEAVLPFKLTVEPIETAVTVKYDINKDNKNTYEIYVVKADVDGARPQGNFAIYVDGQLIKDGAKYSEHITWSPEKSKAYTVKVVYTPTANDPCLVADTEITVDAKLYRNITTVNTSSDGTKQFRCGEKIQVAANVPEFSGWVITDAAGNTVDLGVDLSAKSIELAVPDYDITIEAKGKTSSGSDGLGNIFDMDLGDLTEGDSEWAIINIIRNLIAKFKSFLQQLIETFQSIGD